MPNLGELAAYLVGLVTDAIGASSMRLGAVTTVAVLGVLLVLLSLVARPGIRWRGTDLGHLRRVGRAMALAAESGADAAISIGSAGVSRPASAIDRFQTLAALPLLGHVGEAAARAGVPLRVTTNDPIAAIFAEAALAGAHRRTATPERAPTSTVEYVGEGRPLAAGVALARAGSHGVAVVAGGLGEEALLLLDGMLFDAEWSLGATASASQAAGPLLTGDGSLIGPELFQAPAETSPDGHARTGVLAANRLIWTAIAILLAGSLITWAGGPQVATFLTGR
ncbi:MAG TPA: DUF6754 domain-containing protein [Thermoanaerobaculia bacterium]|jgi:hypothetical protein|nr:DUF6754 domain-containing protein [Thermoanaerobaculia bacterium]